MQLCLSHPTEGYYMKPTHPVFGARGDFITSPEISQVFGELVGIWLLSQYLSSGRARKIRIVELGPGRGTLMDDILRTLAQLPASRSIGISVHLVESSASLQGIQEQQFRPWATKHNIQQHWYSSLDEIAADEESYTMLIAHEFFDALPFHLLEKTHKGWQEVMISSIPDPSAPTILRPGDISSPTAARPSASLDVSTLSTSPHRFRPVLSSEPSPVSMLLSSSSPRFQRLPVGSRIEVSPSSFKIARKVGELVGGDTLGCALVVDYGDDKAFGNSFRAFKNHKITDPFHLPGECDLTANVDFAYLREAIGDTATCHGPLTQHAFLTRMGLQARVQALERAATSEERREAIRSATGRLIDLTGMGKEYKVLGITPNAAGDVWPFIEEEAQKPSESNSGVKSSS
ncbi:hypothetical protein EWM64_g226 [Hericium alpestre]|uniref:Protein arginine methyltransferase NDUFAF7 n=1 Tax=Hericium alpestre TaxID=135208 RepID=A0A4Z0ACF9_9AGAM|nr:hypothetical protein EWM64_g226 [Hericium alpestre]